MSGLQSNSRPHFWKIIVLSWLAWNILKRLKKKFQKVPVFTKVWSRPIGKLPFLRASVLPVVDILTCHWHILINLSLQITLTNLWKLLLSKCLPKFKTGNSCFHHSPVISKRWTKIGKCYSQCLKNGVSLLNSRGIAKHSLQEISYVSKAVNR